MRCPNKFWLAGLLASTLPGATLSFHILGEDKGSWPAVLSSVGLVDGAVAGAGIVVAPQATKGDVTEWSSRVEKGTFLILEGDSPLSSGFGFRRTNGPPAAVRSVQDVHAPKLRIVWEKPLDVAVFSVPAVARVFAREQGSGVPLVAGFRRGSGAVLWIAVPPGPHGSDRFPYLLQALAQLGFEPPFRSRELWAFYDSAYRTRADVEYLADRWHTSGIAALHVAAWHYWERDPAADARLRQLIDVCHRRGLSVYAWLELPHVSERFWEEHPEWREKTAILQDAQLDWRKLMNLTNRAASAAIGGQMRELVTAFDWDGVNLAELYFESLEGPANPARFTPMNDDVRAEFRSVAGFDPLALFDPAGSKNTAGLARFLNFRAELAGRQQAEWIEQLDQIRKSKPQLDLVLTHVDDRLDPSMRDKTGADSSRVLPLLSRHDLTFLIEDPATVWNLGPQRYPQIAARYREVTPRQDKLGIDINVVERYQDVYPTKQQTGVELLELIHTAAAAFPRVALYFENSILKPDWPMLASAASTVDRVEQTGSKLVVNSRRGVGIPWTGPAMVDGKLWPVANDTTVWLTDGAHSIEPAAKGASIRVLEFNGELKSAGVIAGGIEFAYRSSARGMALLECAPRKLEIDGVEARPSMAGNVLILPRGQHFVELFD